MGCERLPCHRFVLLQDILGHPSELPTLKELDHVKLSKSQTTIRQHLQELVNDGILEEVSLPKYQRQNDFPFKFYGLSEYGPEFPCVFVLVYVSTYS